LVCDDTHGYVSLIWLVEAPFRRRKNESERRRKTNQRTQQLPTETHNSPEPLMVLIFLPNSVANEFWLRTEPFLTTTKIASKASLIDSTRMQTGRDWKSPNRIIWQAGTHPTLIFDVTHALTPPQIRREKNTHPHTT